MIDEDVAEFVLDIAMGEKKVALAEVRLEHSKDREVAIKKAEVHSISASADTGMYVRVVTDRGIGFAATNKATKASGKALVKRAARLARTSARKDGVSLSLEKPVRAEWEVPQRTPLESVSTDDRMAFLRAVDSSVMETGVKVQGRFYELRDGVVDGYLATSEGTVVRSRRPVLKLVSVNIVSSKGQSEQSLREWGSTGGWEMAEGWNVADELAEEVRMLRNMIDKGKAVKPGTYDLVCGQEVVGIASHESCGHPMEGDRILGREMSQAGKSFISPDMVGETVGSEHATVIDDPTVPGSYGYYAYDHEGVPARPRYLYREGRINEFLTNREVAGRLGQASNGSSRSEIYWKEPIVRMANTFVAPGDHGEDEILEPIRNGVLMKSFTEWNIDDKRYNQKYKSREAYFIRNGKLAGPARGCTLEITTPKFWGSVDAVSKRLELYAAECGKGDPMQAAAVATGGPSIRLRGVYLK